jgi:hypothetical protein
VIIFEFGQEQERVWGRGCSFILIAVFAFLENHLDARGIRHGVYGRCFL